MDRPTSPADGTSWRRRLGPPAAEGAALLAAVVLPYLYVYRPWGGRWRVPLEYLQDVNFHAMLVKTMMLEGGAQTTPALGAPFGQNLHDFPLGADRLHLLALKALTVFTHDPYAVLKLYYAASFFLIALSAYVVFRTLGLRPLAAGAPAVLFAFLPYHFWHHEARALLTAYYSVPLGVLLAVWVASDGIPIPRRAARGDPDRGRAASKGRTVAVGLCIVVVGSASPYYAAFALCIISAIGLIEGLRRMSSRPLLATGMVVGGILLVLLVNLSPQLLWRLDHGANPQVPNRSIAESETYGLRFTQMLLPSERERLSEVVTIGPKARHTVPGEDDAYLGVFGVAGLVLALVVAFTGSLGPSRLAVPRVVRCLATIVVVAILFGTVGGLSLLIAVLGFTEIRTWSRILLFVGFGALGTLAFFTQQAARNVTSRRGVGIAAVAVTGAVAVGLVDQVPRHGVVPAYAPIVAEQRSDRSFVAGMEHALPTGSMVFQLPVLAFPEGGNLVRLIDYDLLKGYLWGSGRLRWSYGGVKGRESDWQGEWAAQPLPRMIDGLAAVGFSALYVDRNGYPDGASALDAALRPVTGPPVDESPNGRLLWYDLRPVRDRLEQRLSPHQLRSLATTVTSTRPDPGSGRSDPG